MFADWLLFAWLSQPDWQCEFLCWLSMIELKMWVHFAGSLLHLSPSSAARRGDGRPSDRRAPVCFAVIPLLACAGTSTAPKNTHLMESNPLILHHVSVTKAFRAVSFRATLCQVWPSSPENRQTKRNLECKRPKTNVCAEDKHIHKALIKTGQLPLQY